MEEVPSLLHPTSSELDLQHLLRDLSKYKPWITAQAAECWTKPCTSLFRQLCFSEFCAFLA